MTSPPLNATSLADQRQRYATVNVAGERFDRWINQFPDALRACALELLSDGELFDYARFNRSLRALHERLSERLATDGFSRDDVDFTKPYTARSGDLVSYFYRRVNLIPSSHVIPAELLETSRPDASNRALVIVDDYAGSFAQIMGEFYGSRFAKVFNRYRKIYVVVLAAHDRAIANWERIKRHDNAGISADLIREFGLDEDSSREFAVAMNNVDGDKLELLWDYRDTPFDGAKYAPLMDWARSSVAFDRSPKAPLGIAELSSRVAFFYGPPNGAPDVWWNSLGTIAGREFLPLFTRTEDISHYDAAVRIPPTDWVWGGR